VGLSVDEVDDLDARASNRRVSIILKTMRKLVDKLNAGSDPPDRGRLHELARKALRAEYSSKRP
jgi:hypothetical protein